VCRHASKRNVKSVISCKEQLLSEARISMAENKAAFEDQVQAAGIDEQEVEEGFFTELMSAIMKLAEPALSAKEHTARMDKTLVALTSLAPVVCIQKWNCSRKHHTHACHKAEAHTVNAKGSARHVWQRSAPEARQNLSTTP
jgi:hypothetical protein